MINVLRQQIFSKASKTVSKRLEMVKPYNLPQFPLNALRWQGNAVIEHSITY